MRIVWTFGVAAVVLTMACIGMAKEGSHALEHIMKQYHKGKNSLVHRAIEGQASPADIAKLEAAYHEMAGLKPPKGDLADWKKRCDDLIAATQMLAKGEAGGGAALKKAVDCKACHRLHKDDD